MGGESKPEYPEKNPDNQFENRLFITYLFIEGLYYPVNRTQDHLVTFHKFKTLANRYHILEVKIHFPKTLNLYHW